MTNIYNESRFQQKILFDGLGEGRKYGTDIDYSKDFGYKGFIAAEVKARGSDITQGQRIHFQQYADSCMRPYIPVVLEHDHPEGESILLAKTQVLKHYYNGEWTDKYKGMVFIDFYDMVEEWILTCPRKVVKIPVGIPVRQL